MAAPTSQLRGPDALWTCCSWQLIGKMREGRISVNVFFFSSKSCNVKVNVFSMRISKIRYYWVIWSLSLHYDKVLKPFGLCFVTTYKMKRDLKYKIWFYSSLYNIRAPCSSTHTRFLYHYWSCHAERSCHCI